MQAKKLKTITARKQIQPWNKSQKAGRTMAFVYGLNVGCGDTKVRSPSTQKKTGLPLPERFR